MIILPYSTALNLARPPVVTYAVASICVLVFILQLASPIEFTKNLVYYPQSWNPLSMISSALAHGGPMHLFGNLVFYLAFAPALELLLGNRLRYIWVMVVVAFASSIAYSMSVLLSGGDDIPTLGFSGVVMGMIGLSAYLMPQARIRVFFWYWIGWKRLYVKAWLLAAIYIGLDAWTMIASDNYGGINIVAHVAGGVAGYLYGRFRLKEVKEETGQELAQEVEAMEVERKHGKTRSEAFRYKRRMEAQRAEKDAYQEQEKFFSRLYQLVKTDRDSDALLFLFERYDADAPAYDFETVFERAEPWGPSRFLLCLGRLIIDKLDRESRYGRAMVYIEKCQQASPKFILADISRTLFYAQMAIDTGKFEIPIRLLERSNHRYAGLLNIDVCNHLLQKAKRQQAS